MKSGPLIVEHGRGVRIRDHKGRELIDRGAGLWGVNIGYGRTEIAEVAKQAIENLNHCHISAPLAIAWPRLVGAVACRQGSLGDGLADQLLHRLSSAPGRSAGELGGTLAIDPGVGQEAVGQAPARANPGRLRQVALQIWLDAAVPGPRQPAREYRRARSRQAGLWSAWRARCYISQRERRLLDQSASR